MVQIRASSLRHQHFEDLQRASGAAVVLELLRDVETRWSSILLMIERFLHLKEVCCSVFNAGFGSLLPSL